MQCSRFISAKRPCPGQNRDFRAARRHNAALAAPDIGCYHQQSINTSNMALQDRNVGRVIWQIGGNVPAANYIHLPQTRGASLGLTGRFLYLQVPRPSR